jgi:Leucine-rich repeat (LRR) protein
MSLTRLLLISCFQIAKALGYIDNPFLVSWAEINISLVLNLSHNNLSRIEGTGNLPLLKALILNDNKILSSEGIEKLTSLDTLGIGDKEERARWW